MSTPSKFSYSKDEIVDLAKKWMNFHYANLKKSDPEVFYAKYGMLIDFLDDHFTSQCQSH